MDFTLNGRPVSVAVREGASLLEVLREGCGVTSVKDGCAPEGSCGACTVMVEGRAVVSCAQRASRFAGRQVLTQEGLAAAERERWAAGFVAAGASQCGFCSPDRDGDLALDRARELLTQYLGQQPHIMKASGVDPALVANGATCPILYPLGDDVGLLLETFAGGDLW
jgi:predicted molibdopterin-dependent oxidoreductase YjgC